MLSSPGFLKKTCLINSESKVSDVIFIGETVSCAVVLRVTRSWPRVTDRGVESLPGPPSCRRDLALSRISSAVTCSTAGKFIIWIFAKLNLERTILNLSLERGRLIYLCRVCGIVSCSHCSEFVIATVMYLSLWKLKLSIFLCKRMNFTSSPFQLMGGFCLLRTLSVCKGSVTIPYKEK